MKRLSVEGFSTAYVEYTRKCGGLQGLMMGGRTFFLCCEAACVERPPLCASRHSLCWQKWSKMLVDSQMPCCSTQNKPGGCVLLVVRHRGKESNATEHDYQEDMSQ